MSNRYLKCIPQVIALLVLGISLVSAPAVPAGAATGGGQPRTGYHGHGCRWLPHRESIPFGGEHLNLF